MNCLFAEICSLSYAGFNQIQVQRVGYQSSQQIAPLAVTLFCLHAYFNMNSENTQVKYAQLAKKLAVCYIINRKDNRLSGSCQSNRLTPLGALSHGVHEPISVVLRTSFLDAPTTRWVAFSSFCGLKATPLPASFGVVFLCLDYLLN